MGTLDLLSDDVDFVEPDLVESDLVELDLAELAESDLLDSDLFDAVSVLADLSAEGFVLELSEVEDSDVSDFAGAPPALASRLSLR